MVGKTYEVIVDEALGVGYLITKTDNGKSIRIKGNYSVGDSILVKATDVKNNELFGSVITKEGE